MSIMKKITRITFISFTILSLIGYTCIAYQHNNFTGIINYYKFTVFILLLYIFTEYIYVKKLNFLPSNIFYIGALFFFFANSLGELNNFYEKFPHWDDMLHLTSGILIDFAMISIIDHFINIIFTVSKENVSKYLNFLIISSALCSISLGVFWEFYEFSADNLTSSNMQDGLLLSGPTNYQEIAPFVREDNYRVMDKALMDTMEDLFLATCGTIIASLITYFYIIKRKLLIFPLTNQIKKLKKEIM